MVIEYDPVSEDLREAVTEFYAAKRRPRRLHRAARTVLLLLVVAVWVFAAFAPGPSGRFAYPEQERVTTIVLPLVPPLAVAALLLSGMVARAGKTVSGEPARRKSLSFFQTASGFAAAAVMLFLLSDNHSGGLWHPSRLALATIYFGPWIILANVLTPLSRITRAKKLWRDSDAGRRHVRAEFTADGVRITDPLTDNMLRWPYFSQAAEREHLFILRTRDLTFYVVPKRAFATEELLTNFRALLQNEVQNCQFLVQPTGFPVTPVVAVET